MATRREFTAGLGAAAAGLALQPAPLTFFVNRVEGEILNFKEFSPDLKPCPKRLRIWDMTWETYCREEAAEIGRAHV